MPTHLFQQLYQYVQQAERILLVAHKKPDGDTIGSSSSFLNWLLREGKNVSAFCRDLPPPAFNFIDNLQRYTNDPNIFEQAFDLVIIFDSGDLPYCGIDTFIPKIPGQYITVNLDHHVTNKHFADINIVLTDASSTAEVVYHFYKANNIHIDQRMATSLLTGLFTDTNSFTNSATNPKTVEAFGQLIAAGGRQQDIKKHLLHDKNIDSLKIWGLLMSRLRHNKTYDVVTTYLLLKDAEHVENDLLEGVSNFLNEVTSGTDTILFLRELPGNKIKGSFRSVKRDISKVAQYFGGGGHKKAAGFTIDGKIEETVHGPRVIHT